MGEEIEIGKRYEARKYPLLIDDKRGEKGGSFFLHEWIRPDTAPVSILADEIVSRVEESYGELSMINLLSAGYYWVLKNLRYMDDSEIKVIEDGEVKTYPEYWQFPWETLKNGGGDCDCLSWLLASLFRAMGMSAKIVWANFGMVKVEGKELGHAWVTVNHDNHQYLFDPTLEDWGGIVMRRLPDIYEPYISFNDRYYIIRRGDIVEKVELRKLRLRYNPLTKKDIPSLRREVSESLRERRYRLITNF